MKHWMFYLYGPKDVIMEVPVIKALHGPADSNIHYSGIYADTPQLTEEDGVVYGFYGWTTSKEVADQFKAIRNPKYFACKKMDIDENTVEWEQLRSQFHVYEIVRTGYTNDAGESYALPMTNYESDYIIENDSVSLDTVVNGSFDERIWDEKNYEDFVVVIDSFGPELLQALDLLGWSELAVEYGFLGTEFCRSGRYGDDPDYLIDEYYSAISYGYGLGGYKVADRELNPIAVYIFMLGDLLR